MRKGLEELITFADDPTEKSDVSDWIPADVYAQAIFEGLVEAEKLGDVIAVREVRPEGKGGETYQVMYIGARTAQGHYGGFTPS